VHADCTNPTPPEGYKVLVRLRDYKAAVLKLLTDIPEIFKGNAVCLSFVLAAFVLFWFSFFFFVFLCFSFLFLTI
jgi:hypothetical protein